MRGIHTLNAPHLLDSSPNSYYTTTYTCLIAQNTHIH